LNLGDAECARLGYVAQSPDLFEWMGVGEHLETVGKAYPNWDDARCATLASQLGLSLRGAVKDMSGGDKQKLALVLALGHRPDLLLLDEPVASLDPLTRRSFMTALFADQDEAADSPTIVVSSHILSDLERVVSHVAFLRQGRLQLFDTWDAVLEHVRRVPVGAQFPRAALVHLPQHCKHAVIDTRLAPELASDTAPLALEDLFVELNA
jgi:ABC-2 type transport system ATP-binding protein